MKKGFHKRFIRKHCIALALVTMSSPVAWADWQLDSANSQLHFVTIKKGNVAEHNLFGSLSGFVKDNGDAELKIPLATVNTGITIRDSRMKEHLFKVKDYPVASYSAHIDMAAVQSLKVGEATAIDTEGKLALHGAQQPLAATLLVLRTTKGYTVTTTRPIILNAEQFGLAKGISMLESLVPGVAISPLVPVTFVLRFKPEKTEN